jgi:hypothetical protein
MLYKLSAPAVKLRRTHHRHHRRYRNGSAVRALTGAKLLLGLPITVGSQAEAATMVGSNRPYIVAAVLVLQAEDQALLADVLVGKMPLLTAAKIVRKRAELIAAYRRATPEDLTALARAVGPSDLFDRAVVPAL